MLIALLSTLSQRLEISLPTFGHYVNPLNPDARLAMAMSALEENAAIGSDHAPEPVIEQGLKRWLATSSGDARMYSALAVVARQNKDEARAIKLFESALKISQTEQYALAQLLINRADNAQFAEAVKYADTFIRRWPERQNDLYQVIRILAVSKDGYATLMKHAQTSTRLRSVIIAALAETSETLPQLYSAILEMKTADPPPTEKEINLTIDRLIARNNSEAAYRLFVLMLSETEQRRAGTVFNGKLRNATTGKRFDWQIKDTKGVEITLPYTGNGGGALFMFYDRPVTRIDFSQLLLLRPGSYVVTALVSADKLVAPRNLFLTMRCDLGVEQPVVVPSKEDPKERLKDVAKDGTKDGQPLDLIKLMIPSDSYQQERLRGVVEIPAEGCPMQKIAVTSGLLSETWSMKYKGTMLLNSIDIERSQQ